MIASLLSLSLGLGCRQNATPPSTGEVAANLESNSPSDSEANSALNAPTAERTESDRGTPSDPAQTIQPASDRAVGPNRTAAETSAPTEANSEYPRQPPGTDSADSVAVISADRGAMKSSPTTSPVQSAPEHQDQSEAAKTATADNEPKAVLMNSKEEKEAASEYRVWLPTTAGPLLVGVEIQISGRPLEEAFQTEFAKLIDEVSDDSDSGKLGWQELLDHVSSDPQRFGASSARVDGQAKQLIKRYDRNRNEMVDEDEMVRFLFRQSGVSGAFRLQGSNAYRWTNRSRSALFTAMDLNRDRRLNETEMRQAGESILRRLDQNADGCIEIEEAFSVSDDVQQAWPMRRFNRQGDVGMDLAGFVNWDDLAYSLSGYFESSPALQTLNPIRQIDADGNGQLNAEETEALLTLAPAFTIVANFKDTSAPELRIRLPENDSTWISADHTAASAVAGGNAWLKNRDLILGVSLHDGSVQQQRVPRAAFDQVDADNNGFVDREELPEEAREQLSFDDLDQNEDGKLSFEEINQTPARPESIWNVQIRGRAAEHPDGVFAWLDHDHDHFLSAREIRDSSERLLKLLGGRDEIKSSDLPDGFLVQFGRGEPEQDNQRFTIKRVSPPASDERPGWAVKMDSNRDGMISEDEFPGPIAVFEELDGNGDHFLDSEELRAAETESQDEQPGEV